MSGRMTTHIAGRGTLAGWLLAACGLAACGLAACGGRVLGAPDRGGEGGAASVVGGDAAASGGSDASAGGVGGVAGSPAVEAPRTSPCFDGSDVDCGWQFINVGRTASACEFALEFEPIDGDKVNVIIDCELVPTTAPDGSVNWTVDDTDLPNVLRIEGEQCQRLRDGEVDYVDLVPGCLPLL
jgi:hypothetical protein